MNANTEVITGDRELTITRIFDAPRELCPGGQYRIHMLGSDGDHWSRGVFRESDPPKRLVMFGSWADAQGNLTRPETTLTRLFEDLGGKTKLTLHNAIFESTAARDLHQGGWNSALDCLAEYLATV